MQEKQNTTEGDPGSIQADIVWIARAESPVFSTDEKWKMIVQEEYPGTKCSENLLLNQYLPDEK